jgi:hypothetical protein
MENGKWKMGDGKFVISHFPFPIFLRAYAHANSFERGEGVAELHVVRA